MRWLEERGIRDKGASGDDEEGVRAKKKGEAKGSKEEVRSSFLGCFRDLIKNEEGGVRGRRM